MNNYEIFYIFDKPVPFKNLKIHPIKMRDYMVFAHASRTLLHDKNSIADFDILMMSYLEYIFYIGRTDESVYFLLEMLLVLVFKVEAGTSIKLYVDDGKYFIGVGDMVIDENDFDEFRLIVAGQNSVELPDDSVSLIIRKFQEEARRLRNKMSGRGKPGDIEEQMISLSVATGIPLESIFDMTIRKFVKSVERLDLKIHYELYMGAVLGGFAKSDGKGVKHWLSSTDDKSNELISVDEFGAKVGGMPT